MTLQTKETPKTILISQKTVSWLADVLPYYEPCLLFFAKHAIYYCTNGNLMWALLAAYFINFPYFRFERKMA